ncbi:hypothetical protein [Bradyrhizobium sp. AUGA SZCCT0431]|uniref:hypothetical protein n=1 Tax=Bradyrhizobium sp. AUGA SZCCT0431 TaxID=2807674 RepID=UPI001BAAD801|nr:hypothetical protein [Bradyrhizobium sp. AUGA SZCCT0431]MBR1146117.1 hypothetical protein [Bradyrhizobium sp. AUGA SZCCT0431]
MVWTPAGKLILNVNVIRVNQKIAREISGVALPEKVEFGWEQFVLSVTRTRGMQAQVEGISLEKRERLTRYGARIADAIDVYVDETTQEFSFSDGLYMLPDDERPSLAGNVGAAVADLVMERLGFHWRANAAELKLRAAGDASPDRKKKKTPDYVYDPGGRHGFEPGSVVIVEAKGSLSAREALEGPVNRRARSAYKEQVADFVGTETQGLSVVTGFAIAFGAVPGTQTSRIALASPQTVPVGRQPVSVSAAAVGGARFLRLAQAQQKQQPGVENVYTQQVHTRQYIPEQQVRRSGGGGDGGEGRREGERAQPSGRIAFANYENVFLLCGAINAAAFLRRILSGVSEDAVHKDTLFQDFWVLDSLDPILTGDLREWPYQFGIYEPSAESILKSAADNRSAPPRTVELAIAPITDPSDLPGREFVMQGDGLAYIHSRPWSAKRRRWDLNRGDWI